jgi:hypothetical protein
MSEATKVYLDRTVARLIEKEEKERAEILYDRLLAVEALAKIRKPRRIGPLSPGEYLLRMLTVVVKLLVYTLIFLGVGGGLYFTLLELGRLVLEGLIGV